jgi:STE24 endopeptidase
MNPFLIVILTAIFIEFTLTIISELLNLKALKVDPPPELQDIYAPEKYRNSQEYTRVNTRFSLITGTFRVTVLLAFWFTGGFNLLDQAIRSWGLVPIVNGLIYLGILMFAFSLLMLPFTIYSTFVIEEKFGFNRTTIRTFIMDHLKAMVLSILLGAPLLAGILSLFEYAGALACLYCWAVIVLYSLIVQYVAPTWIMPLFNKFTPMEQGELREKIMQYAGSVNFSVKNVFVMDGSKRSSKSNAFFTGFGRNKRIALFDTLIERHTIPELVAVLAHEIGHHKKKHIVQGTIISILHTGLLLFLLSVFIDSPGLYTAFMMEQPSVYTGLLFFGLLYTPIELILSILLNIVSRKNEYEADRFAATTIDEPQSMISALKKLSADNLSNLSPHPFYVFLNYSHPPLLQRIRAIEHAIIQR